MNKKINKILIANRGEIACRIIKTAHRMGIYCVCIYSDVDQRSLHVLRGDEAINIGPAPASQSYLNIEKICEVAKKSGVQAVHPGYGFLSENANFVQELEKNNIEFIGPSSTTIRMMADKIVSKKIAQEAGVNIVPGYMGIINSPKEAEEIAKSIGFPVMIKATAGGGGKGMRIVRSPEEIHQSFISATNEATNSFKDGRIFIEKYIELPRHIEIQIIADKHNNIVCLGERECSIQRHNQKVIEETPSPFLDLKTRQAMYDQCINLAKKVNYFSAGTIEFIVDQEKKFYFLEMNTRLQVEHPVTELVTKIDIVEEMIKIASGQKLNFTQNSINFEGSAIEARIYAEDPEKNFLPFSGRIKYYSEPQLHNNLRIDTGVFEGSEISAFYDPMIAKISSHGANRIEAINIMQKALNNFYISGITTNIDFLSSIFHHPVFISGNLHTGFIAEFYSDGFISDFITEECTKIFIATSLYIYMERESRNTEGLCKNISALSVFINDQDYLFQPKYEDNKLTIIYNHNVLTIYGSWDKNYKILEIKINNESFHVKAELKENKYLLTHSGMKAICKVYRSSVAELISIMPQDASPSAVLDKIVAPISGMLVKIHVKTGDEIHFGQPLFTIEAMKMENVIHSEVKSIVKSLSVKEGSSIQAGEIIIELENKEKI